MHVCELVDVLMTNNYVVHRDYVAASAPAVNSGTEEGYVRRFHLVVYVLTTTPSLAL